MPDVQPTVPNYPPQGIQAQLDLIYLWNPDVAKQLIEKLESGLASLEELTQEINDALSKVGDSLEYKGEVDSEIDLPEQDNTIGDLYYISTTQATFFWSGSEWLKLGQSIDLTPYLTKEEAQETYATNEVLKDYVTQEDAALYATKDDIEGFLTEKDAEETYATKDDISKFITSEEASEEFAAKTDLESYVTKEDAFTEYASKEELEDYAKKTDIEDLVTKTEADETYATKNSLDDYLTTSSAEETYATKEEVEDKLSSVYLYKGSVATKNDLPTEGEKVGDVWNVQENDVNYAWDGTEWDALGGTFDSSLFATKEDLNSYTPLSAFETPITADNKAATMHDVEQSMADFNPLPEQQGHTGFLQTNGATATWSDKEALTNNGSTVMALAVGDKSSATQPATTALGVSSNASGLRATAIGYSAKASEAYDIAIGNAAEAKGQSSIAIGQDANATALYSIQIGPGTNDEVATLNVGLTTEDNYQLLNSSGKIPAQRLASKPAVDTVLTYTENGTAWLPGVTQQWVKDNFINSDASTYTLSSLSDAFSFSKAQLMKVFNEENMPTKDAYTLFSLGWTYTDSENAPSLIAVNLANGKMYFYQGTEENCTANAWKEFSFGPGGALAGDDNLKGVYCTTYGIITLPAQITTAATENVLNLPAGIIMKTPTGRATSSSAFTHTVESTSNFTLFYAGGSWLECGKVDYQFEEPEDNGTDNYQAWWNGSIWQFKSNDTGNVWREVQSATPVCDCYFTGTNLTRIETVGYLWDDGSGYVHKIGNEEIAGTKVFLNYINSKSTGIDVTKSQSYNWKPLKIIDVNDTEVGNITTAQSGNNIAQSLIAATKGSDGTTYYGTLTVGVRSDGVAYSTGPVPVTGATGNYLATCNWINDPTLSTSIVHRTGNETIGGTKTFTSRFYVKDGSFDITSSPDTLTESYSFLVQDKNLQNVSGYAVGQVKDETWAELVAIARKEDGTNVYSPIIAVAKKDGTKYGSSPTPPASSTGTQIVNATYLNDPALSTSIVHKTGNETIAGFKTFKDTIVKNWNIDSSVVPTSAQYNSVLTTHDSNDKAVGYIENVIDSVGDVSYRLTANNGSRSAFAEIGVTPTGQGYFTVPTLPASSNGTAAVNAKFLNDPSLSTNVVHRTGDEAINGDKQFNSVIRRAVAYAAGTLPTSSVVSALLYSKTTDNKATAGIESVGYPDGVGTRIWSSIDTTKDFCTLEIGINKSGQKYVTIPSTADKASGKEVTTADWVLKHGVLVAKQDPNTNNSWTWYRKYSDGWVEQGGTAIFGNSRSKTVNLPIKLATDEYAVYVSNGGAFGDVDPYSYMMNESSILINQNASSSNIYAPINWLLYGYAA